MTVMDADQCFANLVEEYAGGAGVTLPGESGTGGFGSHALKINGSIFAMLVRGHLVVKLPPQRVEALVASGIGEPFEANKGKPMTEWVTVADTDPEIWRQLSQEAVAFVGSGRITP